MNDIASISAIPSALQSVKGAIHKAGDELEKDANVVARSNGSTEVDAKDTLEALIDSRQQLLYTKAAAKLFAASDEMTQSLIDIRV